VLKIRWLGWFSCQGGLALKVRHLGWFCFEGKAVSMVWWAGRFEIGVALKVRRLGALKVRQLAWLDGQGGLQSILTMTR